MLVVGAGVAGLTAAVRLARAGHAVTVRESAAVPGGLLAPVDFDGGAYDRGSHRVHAEALGLLREGMPAVEWVERPRRGVLVLGDRRVPYPLSPAGFARAVGVSTTARMGVGWVLRPRRWGRFRRWERDRLRGGDEGDEGYERFVRSRVGDAAYEAFYRPYVEKVWGIDPSELSASVARQRWSSSSPWQSLRGAAETYWYPRRGIGALIEALTVEARALGVSMRFGDAVDDASLAGEHAVVHTGPLESVATRGGLARRGLYLLHLRYTGEPSGEVDTWYVPGPERWFGRVSRPAAFTGAPRGATSTVLAVEIPEGRWGEGRDFIAQLDEVTAQLRGAGILWPGARLLGAQQTFVRGVYPEYRRGWVGRWRAAMAEVTARGNVYMAGRQGLFLHCNIDHAAATAIDAVGHVTGGGSSASWAREAERWLDVRVRD